MHVDKYITKPIDISQLFSVLNRASEVVFQRKELIKKDIMLQNKEKLEVMSELIENIAHQWRQPLSIISTAISGMQFEKEFDTLTDEKFNTACKTVMKSTKNLSKTIDDFGCFFETNEIKEDINLKEIVENCCSIVKDLYEDKNIEIISDIEDITVKAIKSNMIQIFLTILSNAKDILETIDDKNRFIFIDIKTQNKEIAITIKDNGGGVKDENLSKVFEPYFTTKHKAQGTGLGLYTVYEIVKNSLNGNIEVQNVEYKYNDKNYIGACFTIILN